MMIYRCAERGCSLEEADLDKENCPTCNHPLAVLSEDVESETVEQPVADDVDLPETTVRQAAARRNRRI